MIQPLIIKKILQKLEVADKVLILGHTRPDGDSLGAIFSFSEFLKELEKEAEIFLPQAMPANLDFLPEPVKTESDPAKIVINKNDLVLMLDFGDLKISGLEEKLHQAKKDGVYFVRLDHHPGKSDVANIDVAIPTASSTCEIVYDFFKKIKFNINKNMATCLLTGILTDTEYYTNLGTNFNSLQAGSDLLSRGARLQEIIAHTWRNKQLPTLRLWGKILLRLEEDAETGIATTAITLQDLEEESLSTEDAEGIANFLNSLGSAKAIMVLREEIGGQVKGSLRTTQDDIDVSEIAKQYGGGGHKKSAGFLVPGHIIKTKGGWKVVE